MDLVKVHEKVVVRKPVWIASSYYDYPDGQDLIGKLKYTNKMAALLGSFFGLVAVHNYPPIPTTTKGKLVRYFQILVPALGAATAFTCVTYASTNIRKKDDGVNYLVGGLAAGAVLVPFSGYLSFGVAAGVFIAAAGYFKKITKMENRDLFPKPNYRFLSPYYTRLFDTSLEPDTRRGNWTK